MQLVCGAERERITKSKVDLAKLGLTVKKVLVSCQTPPVNLSIGCAYLVPELLSDLQVYPFLLEVAFVRKSLNVHDLLKSKNAPLFGGDVVAHPTCSLLLGQRKNVRLQHTGRLRIVLLVLALSFYRLQRGGSLIAKYLEGNFALFFCVLCKFAPQNCVQVAG